MTELDESSEEISDDEDRFNREVSELIAKGREDGENSIESIIGEMVSLRLAENRIGSECI